MNLKVSEPTCLPKVLNLNSSEFISKVSPSMIRSVNPYKLVFFVVLPPPLPVVVVVPLLMDFKKSFNGVFSGLGFTGSDTSPNFYLVLTFLLTNDSVQEYLDGFSSKGSKGWIFEFQGIHVNFVNLKHWWHEFLNYIWVQFNIDKSTFTLLKVLFLFLLLPSKVRCLNSLRNNS
jgi:hypothetical protein